MDEKQRTALAQQHLDLDPVASRRVRELEQIPFTFSYQFSCEGDRCKGHKLQILDWEVGQSYRSWSRSHPNRWPDMVREKYERDLPERSDLHLVVGNLARWQDTFVIIGLVYPPRIEVDGVGVQQSLDLVGEQRTMAGGRVGLEAEQTDALAIEQGHQPLQLFTDEG
jgi:hypothetical protein